MGIIVASQTLHVTQALKRFAQEQAQKLLKLNQRISKVQIFLEQEVKAAKRESNAIVKYIVTLPGKQLVIRHRAHDMYQGIVDTTDRVFRQVRKLKERRQTTRKMGVRFLTSRLQKM